MLHSSNFLLILRISATPFILIIYWKSLVAVEIRSILTLVVRCDFLLILRERLHLTTLKNWGLFSYLSIVGRNANRRTAYLGATTRAWSKYCLTGNSDRLSKGTAVYSWYTNLQQSFCGSNFAILIIDQAWPKSCLKIALALAQERTWWSRCRHAKIYWKKRMWFKQIWNHWL